MNPTPRPEPVTSETPTDTIGYHQHCKAIAESCGMLLVGSNAPTGGFTMLHPHSGLNYDVPHAMVKLIARHAPSSHPPAAEERKFPLLQSYKNPVSPYGIEVVLATVDRRIGEFRIRAQMCRDAYQDEGLRNAMELLARAYDISAKAFQDAKDQALATLEKQK